ncbi:serine/threonine protein kinase [Saprolegnia diclina VS20]|uniref:Serine/threonine protein kinase n=1 Tax=Saprolegnia diclina (strain VS20) TaxID=1156394 RepID=T0Q5B3_SAPDV|nr:serine/threonine protein kinase [Saprolegnia diclina VS20]EQC28615.1 serine/threonine protein kinase [Saprolegnia diclina VS20]|eukprot:XP_008618012.1 serine/threonine protein kinase [Saprolegnia diclina VS20]
MAPRFSCRLEQCDYLPLLGVAATAGATWLVSSSPTQNDGAITSSRVFDDEYDIVFSRALGSGAFGMVMQCIHKDNNKLSAVKVIADCYEEATRERTALSCVKMAGGHANIVELNDYYTHDGFHYIVVEFVDGMTLFDYVQQRKRLHDGAARSILTQVASALDFMHTHGMVHCDLKPDNIMIANDESARVKIIDFGSATIPNPRASSMPLKRAITLSSIPQSGTKSYWSPEMLSTPHAKVEAAMDMWSLGCILYIMLSGCHPFDPRGSLSEAEILHNVCHSPVEFSQPVWESVSDDLKSLLRGLLDKNPATRLRAGDVLRLMPPC